MLGGAGFLVEGIPQAPREERGGGARWVTERGPRLPEAPAPRVFISAHRGGFSV